MDNVLNNYNEQDSFLLDIVASVKAKTEKLLEKLASIEKENDVLFSRLNEKEEKIRNYKNALEKMQEENRLLKISNDFSCSENSGIAKQKIASLVKEIDTCVKVLDGLE